MNEDLTPEEQELFDALKAGAVMRVNETTGESEPMAHDDIPVEWRECIRVERALKRIPYKVDQPAVYDTSPPEARAIMDEYDNHRASCPSCIETMGESALMDAEWWATEADHDPAPYPDGTRRSPEQAAAEIYAEAADDFEQAAKIREARGQQVEAAELRLKAARIREGRKGKSK